MLQLGGFTYRHSIACLLGVFLVLASCPVRAATLPRSFFAVKAKIPMIAPEGLPARDAELYAQYYQALHDWDGEKALPIMKERVESAEKTLPPKIRALLLAEYGQLLFSTGDSDEGLKAAMRSVGLLQKLDNQGRRTVSFALIYVCRDRFLAGDLTAGEAIQGPLFQELKATLPPQVLWKVERMFLGQVFNAYRIRQVLSDKRMAVMESWLSEKPDQIDLRFESEIRLLLSIQYRIRGDLPRMERHLERVRSIWESVYGKEHVKLYQYHALLGDFHFELGDYGVAQAEYEKGLGVAGRHFPPTDMRVTGLQVRLAKVLAASGDVNGAEKLARNVIDGVDKSQGQPSYDVTKAYSVLARIAAANRDVDGAYLLLRQSKEIADRVIPAGHPEKMVNEMVYAEDVLAFGHPDEAADSARRVIEACKDMGGEGNPLTVRALSCLGQAQIALGQVRKGDATLLKAERVGLEQADMIQSLPSEAQRKAYYASSMRNIHLLLSRDEGGASPEVLYGIWLNRKGAFFDSQVRYGRALRGKESERVDALVKALSSVRRQLAYAAYSLPDANTSGRQIMEELLAERDSLKADLNRLTGGGDKPVVSVKDVSLPAHSALVDYVYIRPEGGRPGSYRAFVVNPKTGVRLIALGDALKIDKAVAAWRDEIVKGNEADVAVLGRLSRRLRSMLFDPLATAVGDSRHLLVVPDGLVQIVPLEVLQDEDGTYLVEQRRVSYLTTARELAGKEKREASSGKIVIVANPDFGAQAGDAVRVESRMTSPEDGGGERLSLSLKPLPGTEREGRAIQSLVGEEGVLLTGAEASKSALFGMKNPKVLHLATHGFFFSGNDKRQAAGRRTLVIEEGPAASADAWLSPGAGPLLRSGLVLAGANESRRGSRLSGSGILTAEEVLDMDLAGTELVTLSACDSGLGAIADGDGVYGLRRSFLQAGARNLVVGMWSVPDEETQLMMVDMYGRLLKDGRSVGEAFQGALLDRLHTERAGGRAGNPFYWAGFVHYGTD